MALAAVALVATLLGLIGFGSIARASVYELSGPLVQRQGKASTDVGFRGPRFEVTAWGTSVDTYACPAGYSVSNWVVVPALRDTVGRSFASWHTGSGNQITLHVTSSTLAATEDLTAVVSCATYPWDEFPYPPDPIPGCHSRPGRSCIPPTPPGDFEAYWDSVFNTRTPGAAQYAELVQRAFCWSLTYPGCTSLQPPTSAEQTALHDGTNTFSTVFRDPSSTLPPAVHLAEPAGCTAMRETQSSEDRSAYLRLVLRCHRLKRGAVARVQIAKPVRRSFHLRGGSGSIEVRLAKPPGAVQPLVDLGYGPADKSCKHVHDRLRLHSRSFDLRVDARCGRAAGNAVAHLYVGGLIR